MTRLLTPEIDSPLAVSTKSADYTFAIGDAGSAVDLSGGTGRTFSVPNAAAVPWKVGHVLTGAQLGAGQITIAAVAASGVTFIGALTKTSEAGSVYGLRYLGSDVWLRFGRLVA